VALEGGRELEERARLALLSKMQDEVRAYAGLVLVRTKVRRPNARAASQHVANLIRHAEALDDPALAAATLELSLIPVTREEFDFPGAAGAARVRRARVRIEACLDRLRLASLKRARTPGAISVQPSA
jgi:hypothetical protein